MLHLRLESIFAFEQESDEMSKGKQGKGTFGFRPTDWERRAIEAAVHVTHVNRSELIRRCVRRSLKEVVDGILNAHKEDIVAFQKALHETKKQEKEPDAAG